MGDALADLETKLRSSKDKLTQQEEHVLRKCKEKAVRAFMAGALFASGVTWTVTPRLSLGNRLNAAGVAAVLSGMWGFDKILNSCLDHVLSLDGSRLQKELATILLSKHSHNPRRMELVNRHYYPEKVFDDSNMDLPLSRWRRRNVSGDAWSVQRTNDVQDDTGKIEKVQGARHTVVSRSSYAEDLVVDPIEFIFGYPKKSEDAHHAGLGGSSQRRHSHRHRRAARRNRISTATAITSNRDALD